MESSKSKSPEEGDGGDGQHMVKRNKPNHSEEPPETSYKAWTTYRISRIPSHFSVERLLDSFRVGLGFQGRTEIKSLSTDISEPTDPTWRTATVTFSVEPPFQRRKGETTWTIQLPSTDGSIELQAASVVDTEMLGFTPLSPVANDAQQIIDCIFIHGWGGHALGSFKDPNSSYVWIRDNLAKHIPQLRIWTYGYKSKLKDENTVSDVFEWGESLRMDLRVFRKQSQRNKPITPIIFVVHSLGGWVLKEAIIKMKDSNDETDRQNFRSIYGALFFGVPNQGMETTDIASMVQHLPSRYTLNLLDQTFGFRLRRRSHEEFIRAFDFRDSKIISFIELERSPTIQKNEVTGEWNLDGPRKLLVGPSSAAYGRPWENGDDFIVALRADHRTMVKLSPYDREVYPKARNALQEFVKNAVSVIEARFGGSVPASTTSAMGDFPGSLTIPILPPPFAARAFRGREEILKTMHQHLSDPDVRAPVFALYGQGGVGKTQLALKYAMEHCKEYDYILWVYAATPDKIDVDFATIAQEVGACNGATSLDQSRKQLHNWFMKTTRWLLILDNVDDIDTLEPYLPSEFRSGGAVILTSRDLQTQDYFLATVEVPCFNEPAAIDMVLYHLSESGVTYDDAKEIARRSTGLPLALSHMVSYINYNGPTIKDFLTLYDKSRSRIVDSLTRGGLERGYDKTLGTAWTFNIMNLPEKSSEMLNVLALLDPDGIPLEILRHFDVPGASEVFDAFGSLEEQTIALTPLQRTYLVLKERARQSLSVHRLIQDAARRRWAEAEWQTSFDRAVFCMLQVYPRQDKGQSMINDYGVCIKYNAHIISLLDHYISKKSKLEPSADFAEILAHCGWYHYERGQLVTAERILTTAKSICDRVFGGRMSLTLALVYNNLAGVYVSQTKVGLCASHMEICIKHREACLARDDPEIQQLGVAYSNYANNLSVLGRHDEAQDFYFKALDIRENCPGSTPELLEITLYNFGYFYWRNHRNVPAAKKLFERAMAITGFRGFNRNFTLYAYGNLQCYLGQLEEGFETHKACLRSRMEEQGPLYYITGTSFHKVGCLADDKACASQDWDLEIEAIDHLEKAHDIFLPGEGDAGLLPRAKIRLGKVLMRRGKRIQDLALQSRGELLWNEGVALAWKRKSVSVTGDTDKDLEKLVKSTYW